MKKVTVLAVAIPTLAGRVAALDRRNGSPLRGVLYYTSPKSGADTDLAQGAVTGAVCAFVALGLSFNEAWGIIAAHLPSDVNPEAIPEAWRDLLP